MFYVQRVAQGQLIRVEAAAYAEATETLPADNHEIQAWYANEAVENSLKQLKQSDFEMIRVLDDLIQVLTHKGVIRVTDLPPAMTFLTFLIMMGASLLSAMVKPRLTLIRKVAAGFAISNCCSK